MASTADESYPSDIAAMWAAGDGEDVRCPCGVLLVRIDGRWEHEGEDAYTGACSTPGPSIVEPAPDVDQAYRDGYNTGKRHAGDIDLDATGQAWDDAAALDKVADIFARVEGEWCGIVVTMIRRAVESTGRVTR